MRGNKKSKTKKPPRSREYTGPNTVAGVKAYLETDALQKAKENDIGALPKAQQIEVTEWAQKRLKDALEIYRKNANALAKERGFKISDD